eukprot:gene11520-21740_t
MAANHQRLPGIQHFDIHITDKNLEISAKTLISHVKKGWKIEKLQHKVFDDGISNKLVGYFVQPEHTKDGLINISAQRSDIVLVRIYGAKTELFIDRARELRNFKLLQENGLSPALYCTFENGYCYAFIDGRVLGPEDFIGKEMPEQSVKLLAMVHAVRIGQAYLHHHKMEPSLVNSLKKIIRLLPDKFDDPEQQKRYETTIPSHEILQQEVSEISQVLSSAQSPLVLCHNDALCANFIYDEIKEKLWIIDYEYASINHAAYDLANHFNEYAGVTDVNFERLPSKEKQLNLIRIYLEEFGKLKWTGDVDITDEKIEKFYVEVCKFSLASHLFWGIWSIVQAFYSEIDFDFLGYAALRLNEYFRKKPDVLAL